ncbi:MAG: AAA family ATPase [Planctomycetia bacterium]|nr:AAA family ATPase [Planctomycetia bacterium]
MDTHGVYDQLLDNVNNLRQRTARFRRVALHLHSPASHDWPRAGSDPAQNDRARFSGADGPSAFAAELQRHVDLAAITDHMRSEFASRVSESVRDDGDFLVLPGMEVNFRPEAALGCARIHLLVVLREGATPEAFSRLFHGLPAIPDDNLRTGKEEVRGIPLKQWVERVHAEGGICIAAHVENDQGVRCRFRQTSREMLQLFTDGNPRDIEKEYGVAENFKEYLFDAGVDAVEVARSTDGPHYRWVSNTDGCVRWIPTILTFDAHCLEDLARADRVTHLKMTRLGLSGLKDALAFPETRIRFPEALPDPPSPRLCGIQIVGGPHAFFAELTIAFAENLNCLIGARGSGKSTVVEALRYVFGYNRTLRELEKLAEPIREMQQANLADSLIRVVYRTTSGDVRVLEATFDAKAEYATKVFTAEGDYVEVPDVETTGEYPLRLFGWSEIETLGRSPTRQRDLLDRLMANLGPALARRDDVRAELRTNRASASKAVRDVVEQFTQHGGEIRRFKEYQADFERLNTDEVKDLFAAYDLAQAKREVLRKVRENIDKILMQLGDPSALTLREGLQTILDRADQPLRDWWLAEELPRLGLLAAEQNSQRLVREAGERLRSFALLTDEHLAAIEAQLQDVEQKLRAGWASDASKQKVADLRANAEQRLRRVTGLRDAYLKQWEVLQGLLKARDDILQRLTRVQHEISGIRAKYNGDVEATLNRLLPDDMRVSIAFCAGGDTVEFVTAVMPFLASAAQYKHRKLPQAVAASSTPIEFAGAVRNGSLDVWKGKKAVVDGVEVQFRSEDIERMAAATKPFEYDDHADVPVLAADGKRLEQLLGLEEVLWDDHATVLLNGRPVNEMSPGQRSSAMLPLVALTQNAPLVIDQPEDNVDKRLIGSVLANILAQLKERRQIIVCTHDPNLVVGGDAEQVVVLDALSDRRGQVVNHGSIDNDDIVRTIVDLLEGGKEAFEARRKRYGLRAGDVP